MSTQGSTKFKPGDRIRDEVEGDEGTVVPPPKRPYPTRHGSATVWACWDRTGERKFVHEDDCTLIEPAPPAAPSELDRLRALNAKLVAALAHNVSAFDKIDKATPYSNIEPGWWLEWSESARIARAVLAEAGEVAP